MMPSSFLWGAGSAAYQIEGATREDGRGESIWDRFAARPGAIADGSTAEPAIDHYHRLASDVALMRELGLGAYRFSVAWPRIQPDGRGRPNPRGLDWYEGLVERLLDAGIRPFITLYHWDLPQAIQERGGWLHPDTVLRFAEYADMVSYRLADRVHDWITLFSPQTAAYRGYVTGQHAPGLSNPAALAPVAHCLLLAHGEAVSIVRGNARAVPARVGIALDLSVFEPASDRDEDHEAASQRDGEANCWYLDALFRGTYPAEVLARQTLEVDAGAMSIIARPLDFVGVNYAGRRFVAARGVAAAPSATSPGLSGPAAAPEPYPRGLYDVLDRLARDYNVPSLYLMANGACCADSVDGDGRVRDTQRVEYMQAHVEQALNAVQAGLPLHGYFAGSLFDGWEWEAGYTRPHGLVYIDRATLERRTKDSGHWFARLIAAEGEST